MPRNRAVSGCCFLLVIAAPFSSPWLFAQEVDLTSDPLPPVGWDAAAEQSPTVETRPPEPPLPVANDSRNFNLSDQEVAATPRRFRYELKVELRGVYDDNVTRASSNPQDDFYVQIAPEIILGFGDLTGHHDNYVLLDYSPSGYFFVDNSNFDTFEQIARIEGNWRLRRLTIALSQNIQSVESSNLDVLGTSGGFVNQTNLDVGGRRRVNTYSTHLDAAYELTGKTSMQAGFDYVLSDYQGLIGSEVVSGTIGLNYTYSPKLSIGLAGTAGRNSVDAPSRDQTFEQINLHSTYELTGKVSATGSVGAEFRQADNGGITHGSPIFEIGLVYQPFDGTEIDLSATRRVYNSAVLSDQDFDSTQLVVSLRQRFLQRIFFSLVGGYQTQNYFSTINGASSSREDDYYFVSPGVDVRITNFWFAGLFFLHRTNDSSLQGFGFENNQVGARSSLNF